MDWVRSCVFTLLGRARAKPFNYCYLVIMCYFIFIVDLEMSIKYLKLHLYKFMFGDFMVLHEHCQGMARRNYTLNVSTISHKFGR